MTYKILTATGYYWHATQAVATDTQLHIDNGWLPLGGPSVAYRGDGSDECLVAQAVTRQDDPPADPPPGPHAHVIPFRPA